jgi:hypothetical protein
MMEWVSADGCTITTVGACGKLVHALIETDTEMSPQNSLILVHIRYVCTNKNTVLIQS